MDDAADNSPTEQDGEETVLNQHSSNHTAKSFDGKIDFPTLPGPKESLLYIAIILIVGTGLVALIVMVVRFVIAINR